VLPELTTDQKGAIAESAIVHAAIKLGIGVLKPLSDGHRYDLVFDIGSHLVRVQCKWAVRRGEVVVVSCRSARRNREGFLRRPYSRDEIDLIAAYCAALDRSFVLPPHLFAGRPAVQLRLSPAKNNQLVGINWASEYEFAATLGRQVLGP
jgi:hypothetical protein